MATSPSCFDIYMENFLKKVKNQLGEPFNFWYLAYADDLVFSIEMKHLTETLECLEKIAKEYNLRINYKKSGIFICNTAKYPDI